MSRRIERAAGQSAGELLTDPEGARLLNLGETKFLEVQKTDPEFPPPVWLGERAKRHVRGELLGWALRKREPLGAAGIKAAAASVAARKAKRAQEAA